MTRTLLVSYLLAMLDVMATVHVAVGFVAFDPPRIRPDSGAQTVKAGTPRYSLRCEGTTRGVTWRLPIDADDALRSRISIEHFRQQGAHVSSLNIHDLVYTDTGTYVCTYNGTTDTTSIDNSTRVHLYVEDDLHLMKQSAVEFLRLVQAQTVILPCQPTHPDVKVTLIKDGVGPVQMDEVVSFDPKVGFRISPVTLEAHSGAFTCVATSPHKPSQNSSLILSVLLENSFVPPPFINRTRARHVGIGDDFELTCSVTVDSGVLAELSWTLPNPKGVREGRIESREQTARNLSQGGTHLTLIEKGLSISHAMLEDQGSYECTVTDHSNNTKVKSEFIPILEKQEPFLRLYVEGYPSIERQIGTPKANTRNKEDKVKWVVQIESNPEPSVTWYAPNGRPIPDPNVPYPSGDFTIRSNLKHRNAHTVLTVNRIDLSTAGEYRCVVTTAGIVREEKFRLIVKSPPKASVSVVDYHRFYQRGKEYSVKCSVHGFPTPRLSWLFKPCSSFTDCHNHRRHVLKPKLETNPTPHRVDSMITHRAMESGLVICMGCNNVGAQGGCQNVFVPFFVSDVADGFDIAGPKKVVEGDNIKLRCSASVKKPKDIQWYKRTYQGEEEMQNDRRKSEASFQVITTSTRFSFTKELVFHNVSLMDKGRYICRARTQKNPYDDREQSNLDMPVSSYLVDGSSRGGLYNDASLSSVKSPEVSNVDLRELSLDLAVLPVQAPEITLTNMNGGQVVVDNPEDGLRLECRMFGRPRPNVSWTLNGQRLTAAVVNTTRVVDILDDGQVLEIRYLTPMYEGLYECLGDNKVGKIQSSLVVQLKASLERDSFYAQISYPIVATVAGSIILVIVLIIVAKLCYSRCCWRKKFPSVSSPSHMPLSPRLKEYEMPVDRTAVDDLGKATNEMDLDYDMDDCRMSLTLGHSDDRSVSPVYNHLRTVRDFRQGMQHPPSLVSAATSSCHCHYNPCPSSASSAAIHMSTLPHINHSASLLANGNSKCFACDYSAQTLPLNRFAPPIRPNYPQPAPQEHQQQRLPELQDQQHHGGHREDVGASNSATSPPRLSAEF